LGALGLVNHDSFLIPVIAVFVAIIAFATWSFLAIFIHELGHAITAKLVGLAPTQLVVGMPDENDPLFSFRVFGCSVECWPIPFGGATILAIPPHRPLTTFIVAMGGPTLDAVVILACFFLWQHTFLRLGLAAIILSEAVNTLHNLVPISSLYGGVRIPSDGKIILELLARKRQT